MPVGLPGISGKKSFESIYRFGTRFGGRFVILIIKENGLDQNRYAVVASRKLGNAVVRNRTRRRVGEIFRNSLPHKKIGFDVVAAARKEAAEASFDAIEKDLVRLLRKAGLLK